MYKYILIAMVAISLFFLGYTIGNKSPTIIGEPIDTTIHTSTPVVVVDTSSKPHQDNMAPYRTKKTDTTVVAYKNLSDTYKHLVDSLANISHENPVLFVTIHDSLKPFTALDTFNYTFGEFAVSYQYPENILNSKFILKEVKSGGNTTVSRNLLGVGPNFFRNSDLNKFLDYNLNVMVGRDFGNWGIIGGGNLNNISVNLFYKF